MQCDTVQFNMTSTPTCCVIKIILYVFTHKQSLYPNNYITFVPYMYIDQVNVIKQQVDILISKIGTANFIPCIVIINSDLILENRP